MSIDINNLDDKDIIKNIGKHIKKKREIMGLTQESLAEIMDLSITTISRLENGQQCMSVINLIKLARVLKMDVADLFSSYKFSDMVALKDDDEVIIDIIRESTPAQKKFFIENMKWLLDRFPHFQP